VGSDTRRVQSDSEAVKVEMEAHGSAARALDSICPEFNIPSKISVRAITPIVKGSLYRKAIYNDKNQIIANITQNLGAAQFAIYDLTNHMVLTGKSKSSSLTGDVIDLYNCQNVKIGRIQRDTERSFLTAASSFNVQDEQGNLVFKSEKKTETSPVISVFDSNKAELAELTVKHTEKRFEASLTKAAKGENALLLMATLKLYDDSNK
jgi:hypothetical protein